MSSISSRSVLHLLVVQLILASGASGQEGGHDSAVPQVSAVYTEDTIVVDARLDEGVWSSTPAATDFVQVNPDEGRPATQRTEVRFVVDRGALYVGARMFDTEGRAGVRSRLVRRDQGNAGDYLELIFDTFHDHSGRTRFAINPSGVKMDAGQASPNTDPAWDPVWEAAVDVDSLGWVAEIRIPLSQLRFPRDSVQVWGLQIRRFVERLNEESLWSPWRKDESQGPPKYGHLTDIRIVDGVRAFEVLPYVTARASYITPTQPGSPFQQASSYGIRVGGEVKALLTSTLALDAAINPDFGQVEVDPAVVNLSAFETFLPEKRPFFIEGSGLFGFGGLNCYFCNNANGMSLFYSRRIGRRPQGSVDIPARYSDIPDHTGILGAAKVTGRTARGLQVGLLNAVTGAVDARVVSMSGDRTTREVEPLTNYAVGRLRKTYLDGNLTIGGIGTSVVRRFENGSLADLIPRRAEALGLDWDLQFDNQTYSLAGSLAFSNVTGNPEAIRRLQENSARYLQRPDRRHGSNGLFTDRYDPDLTSMRGYGAYARLAKISGDVLWETAVNVRSPGFEANDLAFLTLADYVWLNANILRQWTEPTDLYRRLLFIAGGQQQYNYDGDLTNQEYRIFGEIETLTYDRLNAGIIWRPAMFDDRMTRGGPTVKRPSSWVLFSNIATDARRPVSLQSHQFYWSSVDGSSEYGFNAEARLRPASGVALSFGPRFMRTRFESQYVAGFADGTATEMLGRRAVFATIDQTTLSMDTRLALSFSPTLMFELYAQPLMASGAYSEFKEFVRPRSAEKSLFDDQQLVPVRGEDGRVVSYSLDPDRNPATAGFTFDNPDFNMRSLRGSAVLRWEYLPGSTLYFVWQQSRSGRAPYGDMRFSRDAAALFQEDADDIFVIKAAYWFGR